LRRSVVADSNYKVSPKTVHGFQSHGGRILAITLLRLLGFTTACTIAPLPDALPPVLFLPRCLKQTIQITCGVYFLMVRSAVWIQYRLMTDKQTDR